MAKKDQMRAITGGQSTARRRAPRRKPSASGRRAPTVRDVMVTDVVTIEPAATLVDAARMMEQSNVGMLPVRDDGELRGVITDRDIVVRAVVRNVDASTTPVGDCLTPDLVLA